MEEEIIQIGEHEELLNPMIDPIFKALFTSDNEKSREALKDLISTCIHQKVESVGVVANEPAVDMLDERQIRYDINCVINTGEKVNVEMTIFPSTGETVRLEYYLSKLFVSQSTTGAKKWKNLKKVYQISIIGKGNLFKDKEMIHEFEYYDPEHKISLDGKTRLVTIELPKLKDVKDFVNARPEDIESWAIFFKYANDPEERTIINNIAKEERGVNMALQVLTNISKDTKMRMLAISEEKRVNDYYIDLNSERAAGFDEGRKSGLEEGRKSGLEEGRKSGLEEGRKSGLEEGRKSGLEEGINLGRQSGLEEGRKSGLEEGRKAELEEMIRKMKLSGLSEEMIQNILEKD